MNIKELALKALPRLQFFILSLLRFIGLVVMLGVVVITSPVWSGFMLIMGFIQLLEWLWDAIIAERRTGLAAKIFGKEG